MPPTRMKLRVRRRDNAAASGGGGTVEEEPGRSRESRRSSRRKNTNKTTAATAASSPPPTSSASTRTAMAAEASPDSKCPICLDRFNNLAYLDRCLHRFCFPCIQEWSHNKAECPLCKQPFASILHSVRAEDDFKEYTLRPAPATGSVAATVAMVAAMASAARSDHHMRLMLRRHRVSESRETTAMTRRRRRRERGAGGPDERRGVWEWYLDGPPLSLPPLPHYPAVPNAEDSEEEELEEQTERGVIFEGLTGLGGPPLPPPDRVSRRLMTRLAARQRLQREGGTVRRLRERETLAFRRALYRCGIRVRGIAGVTSGQGQQHDITAEGFHLNPGHLNRLRPWLRRELTVLYGTHASLVDIVQRIIMARLAHHGLEDMATIEEELRPFLLARTEHFLHELVSFARSPLNLEAYDLEAAYEPLPPAATLELDGPSSSSDGSSVIAISEGEDGEEERQGTNNDVIQTGSHLGWDTETPGPSCSTAEPTKEEAEEECLIVGYKKPIAERTPELVQLSSDTEEEEEKKEEETTGMAPPIPSSAPPPSTSGAIREDQEAAQKNGEAWSGSSVCSLSPAMPKQLPDETTPTREMRRTRKKRRRKEVRERSGVLCNPNRSIYPAMMRRRSPSPFHSSADSGSPDSSWELHQVSPLTSSVSSPSHYSSSPPLCSSPPPPPRTPPTLSAEKPGGKRKYKSRHLDSDTKDPAWRPSGSRSRERRRRRDGRKTRDRRRREAQTESGGFCGESSRRSRDNRSPSVEIIYEGTVTCDAIQPSAHKRRRKRHRRMQHSSSPVIITLDSDSSHDDGNNNASGSSTPLSSQQTVDFSDLPPLPLVHSAGVGGALDADIGELPADILDEGSDSSEAEPRGPIDVHSDDSEVDVEKMEDSVSLLRYEDERAATANIRDDKMAPGIETSPSDTNLLATILGDLNQISAPRDHLSLSSGVRSFPETGARSHSHPGEDSWPDETKRVMSSDHRSAVPSSPAAPDVPPVLKRASPIRAYDRNTPPPLKHKDARSPRRASDTAAADPDVLLAPIQHNDKQAIPSITALKRHFPKATAAGLSSADQNLPCPSRSSSSEGGRLTQVDLCSFSSPEFRAVRGTMTNASVADLRLLTSSCSVGFPSDKPGWFSEGLVHTDSTSRGSSRVSPAGLRPPAELCPPVAPGGGVYSGDDSNIAKPVFVSGVHLHAEHSEPADRLSSTLVLDEGKSRTSTAVGPTPPITDGATGPAPSTNKHVINFHTSHEPGPESTPLQPTHSYSPQTPTDSHKTSLRGFQTPSVNQSPPEPDSAENWRWSDSSARSDPGPPPQNSQNSNTHSHTHEMKHLKN